MSTPVSPPGGMSSPTGTTRLAGVLGHPIRHSLSPVLLNAAFRAADLDWVYLAFDVGLDQLDGAIAGARALGLGGLSLTMPLKEAVAERMDRLAPAAARLGAVNAVVRDGDELVGHNTDGAGFVDAVRRAGWDPRGAACVVLGAGGAARAVVLALAEAGVAQVAVVNRTPARAEVAAGLAGPAGRVGSLADAGAADLVVNATPLGMGATDADDAPIGDVVSALRGPGQLVVDLVYHPVSTTLLQGAAARGAAVLTGVGMLVHQAARAFTLWTGRPAPVEAMVEAASTALGTTPGAG